MPTARNLKRRLWLKTAAMMIAMSIFYGLTYFWLNRVAGTTVINPFFPVFIAIIVAILLPILIKVYSAPKIFNNKHYISKEKEFVKAADDIIAANLDKKVYEKLFMDDLNLIPVEGIQICIKLLNQNDTQNNPDLRFYILFKLANYYFNNGDYNDSIKMLNTSLSIRPYDVIANIKVAELYERVNLAEEAIRHYNAALTATETSTGLKEFIHSQIRRIRTEGPRVKQPPDNFKWFTG